MATPVGGFHRDGSCAYVLELQYRSDTSYQIFSRALRDAVGEWPDAGTHARRQRPRSVDTAYGPGLP